MSTRGTTLENYRDQPDEELRQAFLALRHRPSAQVEVEAFALVREAARRALRGPWRLLLTLGTRPLGAALFADPRVTRRPLRFRQIRRGHALYDAASRLIDGAPACLWARRSLFVFRGSRLLVTEVFLPDILALAP